MTELGFDAGIRSGANTRADELEREERVAARLDRRLDVFRRHAGLNG
jgi:hypothetical protein